MRRRASDSKPKPAAAGTTLRVVGGRLRGRKLLYSGDPHVRPMKDRTREALFNLLGPGVKGTLVLDLFGGTGALAFEAISRGATTAIIIERHLPSAKTIRQNIEMLELGEITSLVTADAFRWINREPPLTTDQPWTVFVSPPYRLFVERCEDLVRLVGQLVERAPIGSLFAVEGTDEFDFGLLPNPEQWDVRRYPPAIVGVLEVQREEIQSEETQP